MTHLGLEHCSSLVTQREPFLSSHLNGTMTSILHSSVLKKKNHINKHHFCYLLPPTSMIVLFCSRGRHCLHIRLCDSVLGDTLQPLECCFFFFFFGGDHHLFITFHSPRCIAFTLHWTGSLRSLLAALIAFHKHDAQTHKAMQYGCACV